MMKRRKPYNEMFGLTEEFVGYSIGLGIGSQAVSSIGGNADSLGVISRNMPTIAKVKGGSIILNTLLDINRKMRRR